MKTEYRKETEHDYLIIDSGTDGKNDDLTMLEENNIDHLASLTTGVLNGHLRLYYEVTGCEPFMSAYGQTPMSGPVIRLLFESMRKAMSEAERYFLAPEDLVFDPECIFTDPQNGAYLFCCVPGREDPGSREGQKLAEFILRQLDHDDKEAVLLGYGFYREMSAPGAAVGDALPKMDSRPPARRPAQGAAFEEKAGYGPLLDEAPPGSDPGRNDLSGFDTERSDPEEINDRFPKRTALSSKNPGKERRRLSRTGKTALLLIPVSALAALVLTVLSGADLTAAGGLFFLAGALDWLILSSVRSRENRRENLWALQEGAGQDEEWIQLLFAGAENENGKT